MTNTGAEDIVSKAQGFVVDGRGVVRDAILSVQGDALLGKYMALQHSDVFQTKPLTGITVSHAMVVHGVTFPPLPDLANK